jgi:hypothetical protein
VSEGEDLEEKKLLGSSGYAFAKLTEQEEIAPNTKAVFFNSISCIIWCKVWIFISESGVQLWNVFSSS